MRRASFFAATVTATAANFLGPNHSRTGLILSPPPSGRYTISDQADVVIDGGITITSAQEPMQLSCGCVGELLGKQLFAIHSAGTVQVGGIEIFEGDSQWTAHRY